MASRLLAVTRGRKSRADHFIFDLISLIRMNVLGIDGALLFRVTLLIRSGTLQSGQRRKFSPTTNRMGEKKRESR